MGRGFDRTDLEESGPHIVVPEKQCIEALGINLGDAGEIQYDVVIGRLLNGQNQDLDAWCGPTTKFSGEFEDFRVVILLFTYLKHRTYLLGWRRSVVLPK